MCKTAKETFPGKTFEQCQPSLSARNSYGSIWMHAFQAQLYLMDEGGIWVSPAV